VCGAPTHRVVVVGQVEEEGRRGVLRKKLRFGFISGLICTGDWWGGGVIGKLT
jgi:hypothetical protein